MAKLSDDTKAADLVRTFYDDFGWKKNDGEPSGEDRLFRTFPEGHEAYSRGASQRLEDVFAAGGRHLLIVGCGDMPASHLAIAGRFERVTCMDISKRALSIARAALGDRAEYRLESIVAPSTVEPLYDAVLCTHVVYHIDADEQEAAVRNMLALCQAPSRVAIVYANPRSPFAIPGELARRRSRRAGGDGAPGTPEQPALYYHAHPQRWWNRFRNSARLSFAPWEAIGSRPARSLLRTRRLARTFFDVAGRLERRFPRSAARIWQYTIVVLEKR